MINHDPGKGPMVPLAKLLENPELLFSNCSSYLKIYSDQKTEMYGVKQKKTDTQDIEGKMILVRPFQVFIAFSNFSNKNPLPQ